MGRTHWEHVALRIYSDNTELGVYKAVSMSWDENIEVDRAKYQGDVTPRLNGSYNGGSGSIEFRLEFGFDDPSVVFDAYVAGIKDVEDTGTIVIVASRINPRTRQREARRFLGCQVNQSESGSENSPWAITWNFQYENSERT